MRIRRPLVLAAIAIVLTAGALLAIWGWIQWRYDRQVLTDVAAAPKRPVAIVFGAGIRADGGLSPMLQDRMDTAIALYKAGKVRKLLVSGDNRFADYNGPHVRLRRAPRCPGARRGARLRGSAHL